MRIAHVSDIHIRFGSRHEEYKQVFSRLYEDLKKNHIDRIVVTGDIMHHKVSMSPSSMVLMSEFLLSLSEIAPTDIIAGNHDMNMKQSGQGDVISPLFFLSRFLGSEVVHMVKEDNKNEIDFYQNHVYFYPDSGFFDINEKLTYGVFSCRDEKILELKEKSPDRIYVALWHGALYGARMDNGYENINQASWKKSTFKDFDAIMMGDFHEHQTFENWKEIIIPPNEMESYLDKGWEQTDANKVRKKVENMCYAGSLLQQNFSESMDKGYLIWELDEKEVFFEKKIVPNDWGFAKITITRGESIDERIDNMEFSNNRKKTKVIVVVEDFEENKSKEKEHQIKQQIKDKYKCESVRVEWKILEKEETATDKDMEEAGETFDVRFKKYIEKTEHDLGDDEIQELFSFAYRIEKELGLDQEKVRSKKFDILTVEVRNMFSFPDEPVILPLNQFNGITGIFGENYCGKSNTIRALVFGLFEVIVGTKDKQKIVNIYTPSNKGYVRVIISIDSVLYRITREVIEKRAGGNSYPTKFEIWDAENDTWIEEINDKDTAENKNIKGQITDAIGSYEDFSIIALQAGDNDSDYLTMKQQPKNDLVARYLNLANFKTRKDFVNKTYFTPLRNKIKESGASDDIKEEIQNKKLQEEELSIKVKSLEEEQSLTQIKQNDINKDILAWTKKLLPVESLKYNNKEEVENELELKESLLDEAVENQSELRIWLGDNFKKDIPFEGKKTMQGIVQQIQEQERQRNELQIEYDNGQQWIQNNPKKPLLPTQPLQEAIQKLSTNIDTCENKITTFQGKKCPTCGNVSQQPNPAGEKEQTLLKERLENELQEKNQEIKQIEQNAIHNTAYDKKVSRQEVVASKIETINSTISSLNEDKIKLEEAKDIIAMNQLVDSRTRESESLEEKIKTLEKEAESLRLVLEKFDKNEANKKANVITQNKIDELEEESEAYKQNLISINLQLRNLSGQLAVVNKEVKDKEEKLDNMKEQDRFYRRYKLYLQAVDRQGIPAMVIKTKLPKINEQIQNILQDIVPFKVELEIDEKGDVSEFFYFRDDKSDALPMNSRASASQKFIVTLSIKNALHEVSNFAVSQPSIIMIDEGFGSLDSNHISEIQGMLLYLSTKYKNVIVITHLNEIKDCVDNIIEVTKDRSFLSEEEKSLNPNAGVSQFSFTS